MCPYFIKHTIGKWLTLFYIYYQQNVFPAAFGLTLLYMTVLGFDGVLFSFLFSFFFLSKLFVNTKYQFIVLFIVK